MHAAVQSKEENDDGGGRWKSWWRRAGFSPDSTVLTHDQSCGWCIKEMIPSFSCWFLANNPRIVGVSTEIYSPASTSSREKWHTKRLWDQRLPCVNFFPAQNKPILQAAEWWWALGTADELINTGGDQNFGVFKGEVGMGIRKQWLQSEFVLLRHTRRWLSSHTQLEIIIFN